MAFFVSEYLLTKMNASLTDRQTQILEASVGIIHSEGIQGFTIKNLSSAIGITDAAIYRHFKSKNEILCAVLDNFTAKLLGFISSLDNIEANSLEKIKMVYEKLSNTFTNKPAYVSVIFAEEIFKNNKSLSKKVSKILELNNKAFNSIIKEGQKNNEITKEIESQELTLMVMGSFRLMVKSWKMSDFSSSLIDASKKLYSSVKILIKTTKNTK